MDKNDILIGKVIALGSNAEGIVKQDGVTFFVPYALIGELIEFTILKIKGTIGYGKLNKIIEISSLREKPVCPVYEKCGGCHLQHMEYSAQLEWKKQMVTDCLQKIGNIKKEIPLPIESDSQFFYRNKLQMPIGQDKNGQSIIGFYAEHSHRIIPLQDCMIHPSWAKTIIRLVKEFMDEYKIKGYSEENKTGILRHIVVRELNGKMIITLVSRSLKIDHIEKLVEKLKEEFSEFTFLLNENKKDTNVIFGDKFITLYGKGFFEAEECNIVYETGAQTFVQVNENVRKKLYQQALSLAVDNPETVVVDCYSGGGLLTAMIAKVCKRAYGIELVKEASDCANQLKEKNQLTNMNNICGKVEENLSQVMDKEKGESIRLILDPPRAGISRSVLKAIIEEKIEKIVIISCNPSTLARDLGFLTGSLIEENGELKRVEKLEKNNLYTIDFIQPYDMFPQTKHVETLCCLTLNHKKD